MKRSLHEGPGFAGRGRGLLENPGRPALGVAWCWWTLALCLWLALAGCGTGERPARGFLLISIDTLRADHLGCYGYERETSPFIDSLAARGTVFENAYVQLPGTLPSHMSIFTGLYPSQHNVFPPDGVLADSIPTLPEVLRAHGFRTAGHTEGGYMHGGYGFARGFEEFDHSAWRVETDLTRTFARGLEFLQQVGSDEPFFVFIHTYAVHDPYADVRMVDAHFPEAYASLYWQGPPPPGAVEPTGPLLGQLNARGVLPDAEVREYYRAGYDAQIRYLDDVLADFFGALESLGLMDEMTVVLTSDHGEEFAEHGKLLHTQIYRETLHVPLIVVAPDTPAGRRIPRLVQSVDIAPTLFDLAGVEAPAGLSGVSLVPLLAGEDPATPRDAWVESEDSAARALVRQSEDGGIHQLLWRPQEAQEGERWISRELTFDTFDDEIVARIESFRRPRGLKVLVDGEPHHNVGLELPMEGGRVWISRAASFAALEEEARLHLQSFHRPRRLEIFVDGARLEESVELRSPASGLTDDGAWRAAGDTPGEAWIDKDPVELKIPLGEASASRQVTLRMDSCETPAQLGLNDDRRCLSFLILESQGLGRAREAADSLIVPTAPRTLRLALPRDGMKKRITLLADSCDVPAELGLSDDPRCLSMRLGLPNLWHIELFDNLRDPLQASDLSTEQSELGLAMLRSLQRHRPSPVAPAATRELDPELEDRLRALGYLQ